MQRSRFRLGMAVALASVTAVALTAERGETQSSRFQRLPEAAVTEMITASGAGGSTWFESTDARGQRVTITFLPRFATVVRDGRRVPVSWLRSGDQVEVRGQAHGNRVAASSARVAESRTAGVRLEIKKEPAERR